jgi:hypothetical protein
LGALVDQTNMTLEGSDPALQGRDRFAGIAPLLPQMRQIGILSLEHAPDRYVSLQHVRRRFTRSSGARTEATAATPVTFVMV